jgi:creatinine amidohydrolase
LSVHRIEELSSAALDRLPRERTVVILTVSPLEEHGPHLPLGVDAFTAQHFAGALARRITTDRPGWHAVLAPPLYLGSFTFDHVGTVGVRQRVVREALVDYGQALARAGFRWILVANGHAGPGHLVALEEAARAVSRRHGVGMVSLSGRLAWELRRGRYLPRLEAALGRPLTEEERQAFAEDTHGGWWETSMMLWLRPDLVDPGYRELPAARYGWLERLAPNYPLRNGGQGYVGHPALADPAFARAWAGVLEDRAMELVDGLLDGGLPPARQRSPFFRIPLFRTDFWPLVGGVAAGALALCWLRHRRNTLGRTP